jgi:hypothetical protein
MIHKIISALFIVSFVVIPFGSAHAARTKDSALNTEAKINALQSYIARAYGTRTPLTNDELRTSINAGITWLITAQEPNGHFKYEYLPYEGTYRVDDNMVRQTGALYALGEVRRRTEGKAPEIDRAMEKSISFFQDLSRDGVYQGKTFSCIVKSDTSTRCPLGATSLALVGVLAYVDAHPEKAGIYKRYIDEYVTFILMQQKANGGFKNLYAHKGVATDAESPFSNGEALLALTRYYQYHQDTAVKTAIDKAYDHLKAQPYSGDLHLWIMAALVDMNTLWPKEEYKTYARGFTDWRLTSSNRASRNTHNYCPYVEGIASALILLKDEKGGNYDLYLKELESRNRFHYMLQLTDRDEVRVLNDAGNIQFKTLSKPTKPAIGGFLTGDTALTQRIDFTQHCITAYVQTLVDLREQTL